MFLAHSIASTYVKLNEWAIRQISIFGENHLYFHLKLWSNFTYATCHVTSWNTFLDFFSGCSLSSTQRWMKPVPLPCIKNLWLFLRVKSNKKRKFLELFLGGASGYQITSVLVKYGYKESEPGAHNHSGKVSRFAEPSNNLVQRLLNCWLAFTTQSKTITTDNLLNIYLIHY